MPFMLKWNKFMKTPSDRKSEIEASSNNLKMGLELEGGEQKC